MFLVTVIIPTYNRAHLLPRAIHSVFAQTFESYELIVVDDGSEDNTSHVLASFNGRLRTLLQQHRGVSAARNLGIRHSRGDLVAFLDSDDEWLPDKLALQTGRFDPARPYYVCHSDEIWVRDGREIAQKKVHRKQGGRFFERALERCLISPSSVMISRALLDRAGWFDEELPAAEDYDLWLRITAFYDVDFIPEPLLIKHGGHPDQLSTTVPAIDRFRIRAIRKILDVPDLRPDYRNAAIRELIRKCLIVAAGCDNRGRLAEAEEYRELARSYRTIEPGSL